MSTGLDAKKQKKPKILLSKVSVNFVYEKGFVLQSKSLFIPLNICHFLHIFNIKTNQSSPNAFLLHGAIENARIFYSQNGKGFAWYLAQKGWNVFAADLKGRGLSFPPIDKQMDSGQSESILYEIPLLLQTLQHHSPDSPVVLFAHSWGGVLLMATLARYPELLHKVKAIVLFGSKRTVRVQNPEKWLKVDFFWRFAAHALSRGYGYLPAKELKIGSDNESIRSHSQGAHWTRSREWLDSFDGFDYAKTLKQMTLPPVLYLAAPKDYSLGHPADVRDFMHEVAAQNSEYWLLSKAHGFRHDYGHIDMLTHPQAPADHFPLILDWVNKRIEN